MAVTNIQNDHTKPGRFWLIHLEGHPGGGALLTQQSPGRTRRPSGLVIINITLTHTTVKTDRQKKNAYVIFRWKYLVCVVSLVKRTIYCFKVVLLISVFLTFLDGDWAVGKISGCWTKLGVSARLRKRSETVFLSRSLPLCLLDRPSTCHLLRRQAAADKLTQGASGSRPRRQTDASSYPGIPASHWGNRRGD